MSLHPQPIAPVPAETARAAFPGGNPYLALRDEPGTIFADDDFAALYPRRGRPAEAPWRLALVTVLQFAEGLSDRRAADAVRGRVGWKYALGLALDDPGFGDPVLCESRRRLLDGPAEQRLLEVLLDRCRERGRLKVRGRQRTDSTHVLARIRASDRLECVIEAVRHALDIAAAAAPGWLAARARPGWAGRYERRPYAMRIPDSRAGRRELAGQVGEDGLALLEMAGEPDAPRSLRGLPALGSLRRIRVQQFYRDDCGLRRRTEADGLPPASLLITSPHDVEARYGKERSTTRIGYKVHLTETCDDDVPHPIVDATATPAPVPDGRTTSEIHRAPSGRDLLPGLQMVDARYIDADLLMAMRREHDVELVGPMQPDHRRRTEAEGAYTTADFAIDWDGRRATCPEGRPGASWTPAVEPGGTEIISIKFSTTDCRSCPARERCTRPGRRSLTVRRRGGYEALRAARSRESTEGYRAEYARRAGIEGTISQGCGPSGCGGRDTSVRRRRACSTWPRPRRSRPRRRLADGEAAGGGPPARLRQADDATTVGLTNSPAGSLNESGRTARSRWSWCRPPGRRRPPCRLVVKRRRRKVLAFYGRPNDAEGTRRLIATSPRQVAPRAS
jgi:transposase